MKYILAIAMLILSGCAPVMAVDATLRVAMTIFAESKGESLQGKRAVASVIYNRTGDAITSHRYSWDTALNRVCRSPAFSCWQKGWPKAPRMDRPLERAAWFECYELARQIQAGVFEPSISVRHYAEKSIRNYWTKKAVMIADIGGHRFYE